MKKHFRKHDPGRTSSLSLPVPLEPSPLPGPLLAAQTHSILPAPSLQVLLSLPNPSGSSAPLVTPHQATTQQLLPSPCFNFPDPSQPLRAQTRGAATPQPCPVAERVQRDGPAGHARPNCCSSPSPRSVAGGTPTTGRLCRRPVLISYSFRLTTFSAKKKSPEVSWLCGQPKEHNTLHLPSCVQDRGSLLPSDGWGVSLGELAPPAARGLHKYLPKGCL